jgi:tetratricopeptide (TPR) repeat protein
MSGGRHFSFPWIFSRGIVGTNQQSIGHEHTDATPCGHEISLWESQDVTGNQHDTAESPATDSNQTGNLPLSEEVHCGYFGMPRDLLAAQGYLELATGPASRLGLAPKLRRRTLRQVFTLAANCRVHKRHQPARQMLIGQSLRLLGKHRSALTALRKASLDKWLRRDALLGLAWCQKRLGLIDEAIATITRALATSPNDADLHYNLACYLALAMQPRAAIYELAWAVELKPSLKRRANTEADFDSLRVFETFAALTDAPHCQGPTSPTNF